MTDRSQTSANGTAPQTTADTDRDGNCGCDGHRDSNATERAGSESEFKLLHIEPDPRAAEVMAAFIDWRFDDSLIRSVDRLADAWRVVNDVDCVVTEHWLPDGTGVELVERARERDVQTPFVFHTTCHDPIVESNAVNAGADAYVRKQSNEGQYDRLLRSIQDHARTTDGGDAPNRSGHGHGPEGLSEPAPMPLTSEE